MFEKQQSPNGGEVVVEVVSYGPEGSDSSASETLTKRRSFSRSAFSIPKSRFGETSSLIMPEETSDPTISCNRELRRIESVSARNAQLSQGEDEEICKVIRSRYEHRPVHKKILIMIEWIVVLSILGCLVASLTVSKLKNLMVWGLEIWKWCVLFMVVSCGMSMTNWVMHFIVSMIERNSLLRKKMFYFVYRLKMKSVQILMWASLVLLTWLLLIKPGLQQSKVSTKIVAYITRSIVAVVMGAFLLLSKTLLVKILASKFKAVTYFNRIQESILHQYIIQTLSGHPRMEEDYYKRSEGGSSQLSYRATKKEQAAGVERNVIDMTKLQKTKQEKVSSWTMKVLEGAVTSSGLSTISYTVDGMEGLNEREISQITSETEAVVAAYDIFRNVAQPDAKDFEEWDLLRFMTEEEVELVWPMIDVAKTGQVDRRTLTEWVVKAYTGRKALAHALSDTKAVAAQVDNLVTSVVVIIIIVVSLLIMEIATTSFFVFLSSQLVLAAIAFGNTCKNVFESIVFLFVAHPYDVGDCIVFEGIPMIVEEMNIFTTVFLKLSNNEKVYYPNSVLSAKSISNYSRSPDMRDAVEFSIALTPVEKIVKLKEKIREYIEGKHQYWHPQHHVAVIDIEDINKLKMAVYCQHIMNFQDYEQKNLRRAELNFELLKILEELSITVI